MKVNRIVKQLVKMSTDMLTLISLGEDPKPLLVFRIKTFLDAVEFSSTKEMKTHAAMCLVAFVSEHLSLVKEIAPKFLDVFENKVNEFIENVSDDDSCFGFEFHSLCVETLEKIEKEKQEETPMTPKPKNSSSSNAATCPGAPSRPAKPSDDKPTDHELSVAPMLKQDESESEESYESESESEDEEDDKAFPVPHYPIQTKKGEIYRAESKEGKRSTVKCLEDNGRLLELRFDNKTGAELDKYGRRIFQSYKDWQEEIAWM